MSTFQQKMKGKFSFLDRFSNDKDKNSASSEFDRTLAAIRNNQVEEVECNENFTDDNIAEICLAIQQSEHVSSFRVKNISVEPSIEFITSLCSTTRRLTRLRLSNTNINEHESNCLVAALLNNKSLKSLSLDHNNITNSEQWAQLLKINRALETLDLSNNHICTVKGSDGAITQLGEALIGNTRLRDLNLSGNGFQESSIKKFVKLIKENGNEMGIRSTDLVNDSSLSQAVRDELSSVMARPWAATPSTNTRPRQAEAISPTTSVNALSKDNVAALPATNHHVSNSNNNNNNDEVNSVSNLSMSHLDGHNNNNNNNSSSSATEQELRAAKLQKLQQMKARHASEIQQKDQIERELREQVKKLETSVERLKKDLVTSQQVAAAATAASSSASNGENNSDSNNNNNEQQQQQIQQLTSIIEEMSKKHSEEFEAKDEQISAMQKTNDIKFEQLSGMFASLTAEHEQGEVQISNIQKTMENDKKKFHEDVAQLKVKYEEKEKELIGRLEAEKKTYADNANRLQEQFDAANQRAESLHAANKRLETEASEQMNSLQQQLAEALASSTSPIAGFFEDDTNGDGENNNNNNSSSAGGLPNQSSTKVQHDAIVQTDPLPTLSHQGGANRSGSGIPGSPNATMSVPSMDISSVTRFKMPEGALTRPSSDDSFVPSDDEEEDAMRNPDGKAKYLPKAKWMPDEKVTKCMACKEEFGVFTRKHHCRCCGKIYCDECSPVSKFEKVRICHMCASSQHSKLFV